MQVPINSLFSGIHVAWSLVLCVMFCSSLFVVFLLTIILSVLLWLNTSDYLFGIFKLFSQLRLPHKNHCTNINYSTCIWILLPYITSDICLEWMFVWWCLTPNEQLFSYIMVWTSYICWDDDDNVYFILDHLVFESL